jgi:plasmid stability protein
MSGLLIKNMPPDLHQQLKDLAREHHRSLMQEALTLLEEAVRSKNRKTPPTPYQGSFMITNEWIDMAKREGRE